MKLLEGKKILITGVISARSIAYAVAQACFMQGAELAFTYQSERFESRVKDLAKECGSDLCFPCDVAVDHQVSDLFASLNDPWEGRLDGLLHSIAYAPADAIKGRFLDGCTRSSFLTAHDISSYSFTALVREALNGLKSIGGTSFVTLTYLGSERVVPNYNVMGLAKASLESSVRYLASDLGIEGMRVNAVSPGPIKTLAAAGIAGFSRMLSQMSKSSFLGKNISAEEVADVVVFLFSHLSRGITGEVIYVDGGFNHAVPVHATQQ